MFQPKQALLAASVAGATVLHEQPEEKLSIYSADTPDVLLVETPSALENQIGVVRRQARQVYRDGRDYVQGWVSKWVGVEHAVENRVKAIISPHESLTPGLLYVGVATLTGSILARNRLLVTRLIIPPVFLVASAKHFLPKTTQNLSDYLGSVEDAHFPAFAEKHEIAKAHTAMTWERIKEATKDTRANVNHGALTIVEKIQEATGLKLRETLGLREEMKHSVETKAAEAQQVVEQVVEETGASIEKKLEEVSEKLEKVEEDKRLI
ncbi:Mitochondrial organizing structure protein 2 [Leucoagaricus sp. SymC.cos]|nr:Mitochondrial organizing structure protein 2 [Leucoagaricus sp. SymC.cos]